MPPVTDVTRTAAAIAGMNATIGASLWTGALTRRPRLARNVFVGPAFDITLALAGVHLEVEGEENLRARRPAIFAFNHRSNLDPLVVCKLVRRDFTSTGKAEVRRDPAAALTAIAIDAVLIDRDDPERARRQMGVAAERLRGGESVLIAPEGTRNAGVEPGAYRTGVVHLAIAAQAPVVPVVLSNTRELMPKVVISPGTVGVRVLAPVDTSGWQAGDARRHAEELREMTAQALRGLVA